jgi:hypothetical protein
MASSGYRPNTAHEYMAHAGQRQEPALDQADVYNPGRDRSLDTPVVGAPTQADTSKVEIITTPIKVPGGPVQNRWYSEGYQAAMIDIANTLVAGGEDAVREWLQNNTRRTWLENGKPMA